MNDCGLLNCHGLFSSRLSGWKMQVKLQGESLLDPTNPDVYLFIYLLKVYPTSFPKTQGSLQYNSKLLCVLMGFSACLLPQSSSRATSTAHVSWSLFLWVRSRRGCSCISVEKNRLAKPRTLTFGTWGVFDCRSLEPSEHKTQPALKSWERPAACEVLYLMEKVFCTPEKQAWLIFIGNLHTHWVMEIERIL